MQYQSVLAAAVIFGFSVAPLGAQKTTRTIGCDDQAPLIQEMDSEIVGGKQWNVTLRFCRALDPDDKTDNKSRVLIYLDYAGKTPMDADRTGDGRVNSQDWCADTSEVIAEWRPGKKNSKGPGEFAVDGELLKYSVHLSDLSPSVAASKQPLVYASVIRNRGAKGLVDQWPRTEGADVCEDKPWKVVLGVSRR